MSAGIGGLRMGSARSKQAREDAGTWLDMLDVDGTPITYGADEQPVRWRVVGYYATQYKQFLDEETEAAKLTRAGGKKAKQTDAQRDAENEAVQARVRARCVLEWEGMFDETGETAIPCTPENAGAIMAEARWIRDRVSAFVYQNLAFFQNGSTSS